ncbi:MAG: metalloregulator ArsR/SmtB family transcription factor [Pseudomonadales bacterium]|nr:metalloregulator ArsR/SmtB family transcription factor [Pseudomonadales bacterium]
MDLQGYAALFKALSEPARLRIVHLLRQRGELCVCDLVDALQLPQSAVSRHLAYLRRQGLVTARRSGTWMYYQLAPANAVAARLLDGIDLDADTLPELGRDAGRLAALAPRSCS